MAASKQRGGTRRIVAVELGFTEVRAVEVEARGTEVRILKKGAAPVPDGAYTETAARDALAPAIRAALSAAGISARSVVAALPRRLVTMKLARLPQADPEQVRGMVQYEAQQYIPFPIEDVVLDHQVISDESEEMTRVMIVAARRGLVEAILAAFDAVGLEVARLSVSSFGLAEHGRGSVNPIALLEIEPGEVDMVVVGDGRMLFSRSASLAGSFEAEDQDRLVGAEIARSIAAYDNEHRGHPVTGLYVSGPSASAVLDGAALRQYLDLPIERLNGRLLPLADPQAGAFATAVGLAIAEDPSGAGQVNLIPASRAERKQAARRRLQSIAALAVFAVLAFLAVDALMRSMDAQAKARAEAVRENNRLSKAVTARDRVKEHHAEVVKTYQTASRGLARNAPAVDIVKALSDAVPANRGIYLTQFSFERGGNVAIHGNAGSEMAATEFVSNLQQSGLFTQVRLGYMGEAQSSAATTATAGAAASKASPTMSFIINARQRDLNPPEPEPTPAPRTRQPRTTTRDTESAQ